MKDLEWHQNEQKEGKMNFRNWALFMIFPVQISVFYSHLNVTLSTYLTTKCGLVNKKNIYYQICILLHEDSQIFPHKKIR